MEIAPEDRLTPDRFELTVRRLGPALAAALVAVGNLTAIAGLVLTVVGITSATRGRLRWGLALLGVGCLLLLRESAPLVPAEGAPPEAERRHEELAVAAATAQLAQLSHSVSTDLANSTTETLFDLLEAGALQPGSSLAIYQHDRLLAWRGPLPWLESRPSQTGLQIIGGHATSYLVHAVTAPTGRMVLAVRGLDEILPNVRLTAIERAKDSRHAEGANHVEVRDLSGRVIGLLSRYPTPVSNVPNRFDLFAVLSFVVVLLALAVSSARDRGGWSRGSGVLLVVAARLTLRADEVKSSWDAFRPTSLAVVSTFDLFASPADLFLTSLSVLLIAVILASQRFRLRGLVTSVLFLNAVAAVAATSVLGLLYLLRQVADNSELSLADESLLPFNGVRLTVVVSFAMLTLGYMAATSHLSRIAVAAIREHLPGRLAFGVAALSWVSAALLVTNLLLGRAGHLPILPALLLFALPLSATVTSAWKLESPQSLAIALLMASVFALSWSSSHYSRRALTGFLEHDLAGTIRRRDANLRWVLESVIEELEGDLGQSLVGETVEDIAYASWRQTRLRREPYRSAFVAERTGSAPGRFAFRLPLPTGLRPAQYGRTTLQEVMFQGRSLGVLAGAARLPDGTVVTVRIAENQGGAPFFPDSHHHGEIITRGPPRQFDAMARTGVALTVVDSGGRVMNTAAGTVFPIPRAIIERAGATDASFWWSQRLAGGEFDALTFASSDRTLTISLPRLTWKQHLVSFLHLAILLLFGSALVHLAVSSLDPERTVFIPGPGWVGRSYYRKVAFAFALVAIVPALAASFYLQGTIDAESRRDRRKEAVTALEFGRRILSEFAADDPRATIDDSTLIWISETIGHDIALFDGGQLQATSMRELFREGLLSPHPAPEAYRRIALGGAPIHILRHEEGDPATIEVTAPLGEHRLLSLYSVQHGLELSTETEERTRVLFLATVGIILAVAVLARWVARRTTDPVRELTAATARVAAGDLNVQIASEQTDELSILVESFNRMAATLRTQSRELSRRAEYLTQLLENATTGILSVTEGGEVTTVNPAALRLLDIRIESGALVAPALHRGDLEPLARALGGTERIGFELRVRSDETTRTLRCVVVPLQPEPHGVAGRLALLDDVSDIVKSKKLEAWAEMARRIAHEIKNPLTPIQLAAEHARRVVHDRRGDVEKTIDECVGTILRQVEDLRKIASEFSTYAAGPRPTELRQTNIAEWARELVEPYLSSPPDGIRVELDVADAIGHRSIDPARLRRAVLNLIENGLQSISGTGHLKVRVASGPHDDLVIEVSDDGLGMDEDLVERVFDPYFSTKDAGSGLGLANAKRTVDDHSGRIELESAPGSGTTVRIVLPGNRESNE